LPKNLGFCRKKFCRGGATAQRGRVPGPRHTRAGGQRRLGSPETIRRLRAASEIRIYAQFPGRGMIIP